VEKWKQQEEFGPPNIRMSIDISGSIHTVFDMNSIIVVGRFAGLMRAFAIELFALHVNRLVEGIKDP
jgi:hypothetical protein